MTGVKPWHIVVFVAAIVAVGASAYLMWSGSDSGPAINHEMTVVDITTGDLYSVSLSGHKFLVTPGINPQTGKVSLFPVHKNAGGSWAVSARDLSALSQVQGEPKALIDRRTGEVKVTSETPKPLPEK
jgi:hypothetical protein